METSRWINQGDRRYMTMATCPEHGKYLVRIKFRKSEEGMWSVTASCTRPTRKWKIITVKRPPKPAAAAGKAGTGGTEPRTAKHTDNRGSIEKQYSREIF
jgi:hypothetical protein